MRWLSLAEVLELHRRLIEQTGGMPGLRDLGLLEGSLAQPHQSYAGIDLYPGLSAKAAALGFSLIANHPFLDGNKRIGHAAMEITLAPRHRVHFDETFAPPLCAPARVIPGRTLLEGEGRVGSRASPQLQSTPSVRRWWLAGVPIPVPPATKSAQ